MNFGNDAVARSAEIQTGSGRSVQLLDLPRLPRFRFPVKIVIYQGERSFNSGIVILCGFKNLWTNSFFNLACKPKKLDFARNFMF